MSESANDAASLGAPRPTRSPPPGPAPDTILSLDLDSRLESGREAARAVGRLCQAAGFDTSTSYAVGLCTAEAVVNAVRHAYGGRAGHLVRVVVALAEGSIAICVADEGGGLPQGALPPPEPDPDDVALEEHEGGGWGLLLMHRLMDRVELLPGKRGTCLRLTKHLPRAKLERKDEP